MKTKFKIMLMASVLAVAAPVVALENLGMVDFHRCIEESKFGKYGRDTLIAQQKQLAAQIEATQQELSELMQKSKEPGFQESLSSVEEEKIQTRLQQLYQQVMQQQEQYPQILAQAEMNMLQQLTIQVMRASQIVGKEKNLRYILRGEAFFLFDPQFDVTTPVIAEMDKLYATEHGEAPKSSAQSGRPELR